MIVKLGNNVAMINMVIKTIYIIVAYFFGLGGLILIYWFSEGVSNVNSLSDLYKPNYTELLLALVFFFFFSLLVRNKEKFFSKLN